MIQSLIMSPDLTEVMENSSKSNVSHMHDWLNSSSFVNLVKTLFSIHTCFGQKLSKLSLANCIVLLLFYQD